jgi:hypothetical protein
MGANIFLGGFLIRETKKLGFLTELLRFAVMIDKKWVFIYKVDNAHLVDKIAS